MTVRTCTPQDSPNFIVFYCFHIRCLVKYVIQDDLIVVLMKDFLIRIKFRASLVAQWLRIHLPMQGTRVRALVWEDPTCRGAAKPVHQLLSPCSRACEPQLLKPTRLEPMLCVKRSHSNEKPAHPN